MHACTLDGPSLANLLQELPHPSEEPLSIQPACAQVRQTLSGCAHLAVLEGVDPMPSNIVAAGFLAVKSQAREG